MFKGKISFINGIIFFVVGLFIFLNPDMLVKFISYFVGGVLIAMGLYKTVNYYIEDKKMGIVNQNELGFGITAVILGILFICLAGTIELLLRFIVGGYLILAGVSRIANTFYTTNRDNKFYALLIMGVLFIGVGLYIIIVSNLALALIGMFMMIYGVIDFISYFVYKDSKLEKANAVEEAKIIEEKNDVEEDK